MFGRIFDLKKVSNDNNSNFATIVCSLVWYFIDTYNVDYGSNSSILGDWTATNIWYCE